MLVSGELGSGKTTFVRGACRALGVEGPVTSPTFTIGQVLGESPEVAHLDLYRLGSLAGEDPALLEDYLTPERVGFVEWPAVAEPALERVVPRASCSSTRAATAAGSRWRDPARVRHVDLGRERVRRCATTARPSRLRRRPSAFRARRRTRAS